MAWWCHQMETFSMLLAICAGNSPVPGEFPAQRPVTWSSDVFFDLCLNKRLSKQWWGWWFETPWGLLWRHYNGLVLNRWQTITWNSENSETVKLVDNLLQNENFLWKSRLSFVIISMLQMALHNTSHETVPSHVGSPSQGGLWAHGDEYGDSNVM